MNKRELNKLLKPVKGISVENMRSSKGHVIPNQLVIGTTDTEIFRSFSSIIAIRSAGKTILDTNKWDYSVTTGKYRNQFLGETKKETQRKIDSGEYILADLN